MEREPVAIMVAVPNHPKVGIATRLLWSDSDMKYEVNRFAEYFGEGDWKWFIRLVF